MFERSAYKKSFKKIQIYEISNKKNQYCALFTARIKFNIETLFILFVEKVENIKD